MKKQAVSPFKETACFFCGEKSGKVRFCNFFAYFPKYSSSAIRQNDEKS